MRIYHVYGPGDGTSTKYTDDYQQVEYCIPITLRPS